MLKVELLIRDIERYKTLVRQSDKSVFVLKRHLKESVEFCIQEKEKWTNLLIHLSHNDPLGSTKQNKAYLSAKRHVERDEAAHKIAVDYNLVLKDHLRYLLSKQDR